VAGCI